MSRSDEDLRDGCLRKLEAEASIGVRDTTIEHIVIYIYIYSFQVLAALVAGSALSLICTDSIAQIPQHTDVFQLMLIYSHVASLTSVFGAGMLNVVSTSLFF